MTVWLGPTPIAGPWDVVAMLDVSWRILCGQIPNIDYHDPIGPLTYLPVVFAMKAFGPSTLAICCGNVLTIAFLLPWAWRIASARLQPYLAFVFVLFSGFLLLAPRPLGYGIRETTYAMLYNREGYVLLSLFFIGLFLPRKVHGKHDSVFDGLSTGLLLGLMLYCKITYFAVGVASLFVGIFLVRRPAPWFLSVGSGMVMVCTVFYFCFRIHVGAYLSDVLAAGHSQSPTMRFNFLAAGLKGNLLWIYLVFLCLGLSTYAHESSERPAFPLFQLWLTVALIIAAAFFIETGNSQRGGLDDPLFFVAGVVILELFRRHHSEQLQAAKSRSRLVYAAIMMVALPIFCAPIFFRNVASFAYSTAWNLTRRSSFDASRRIDARPLHDFLVPESTQHVTAYWPAPDFPVRINEGIALLRRHLSNDDHVAFMGYVDPFPFALGLKPPRGGIQFWDLYYSFNEQVHPSPRQFLGDASLVMVPKRIPGAQNPEFKTVDAMINIYGDYLQSHFRQIDSSEAWTLYRSNHS